MREWKGLKKGMSSYSSSIMLIPRKLPGIPEIVTIFRHEDSGPLHSITDCNAVISFFLKIRKILSIFSGSSALRTLVSFEY